MSFNAIYKTYYPKIVRYSFKITKDVEASEDIAQETFIRASDNLSEIQSISPWLYKTCKNLSLNYVRSNKFLSVENDKYFDVNYYELSYNDKILTHNLPLKQRLVIDLTLKGYNLDDIKEETGMSYQAVKANYHYALVKLQKTLNV